MRRSERQLPLDLDRLREIWARDPGEAEGPQPHVERPASSAPSPAREACSPNHEPGQDAGQAVQATANEGEPAAHAVAVKETAELSPDSLLRAGTTRLLSVASLGVARASLLADPELLLCLDGERLLLLADNNPDLGPVIAEGLRAGRAGSTSQPGVVPEGAGDLTRRSSASDLGLLTEDLLRSLSVAEPTPARLALVHALSARRLVSDTSACEFIAGALARLDVVATDALGRPRPHADSPARSRLARLFCALARELSGRTPAVLALPELSRFCVANGRIQEAASLFQVICLHREDGDA